MWVVGAEAEALPPSLISLCSLPAAVSCSYHPPSSPRALAQTLKQNISFLYSVTTRRVVTNPFSQSPKDLGDPGVVSTIKVKTECSLPLSLYKSRLSK